MSPIVYVLCFVAALLAAEALTSLLQSRGEARSAAARRRLRRLAAGLRDPAQAADVSILRRADGAGAIDRLVAALPGREVIELALYRAGLGITARRFAALSLGLGAFGVALVAAFAADSGLAWLGAGLGLAPWLNVRRLGRKRCARFEQQFPDALDLLIRALRAGHSLSTGVQMVGQELPEPVGSEFTQMADEIKLGQTVSAALSNLAYRVNSPDLPFFVTAITIQQETGSNLAEVLENLASVIRERFKLFGKVRALTAMGRGTANILAVWPLVMVGALCVVNRDYVAPLWETEVGHTLALVSAVMVAVGYVLCRRMARIEV